MPRRGHERVGRLVEPPLLLRVAESLQHVEAEGSLCLQIERPLQERVVDLACLGDLADHRHQLLFELVEDLPHLRRLHVRLEVVEEHVVRLVGRIERSEEHTSELQSRGHLVCRLLLEKKKKKYKPIKEEYYRLTLTLNLMKRFY